MAEPVRNGLGNGDPVIDVCRRLTGEWFVLKRTWNAASGQIVPPQDGRRSYARGLHDDVGRRNISSRVNPNSRHQPLQPVSLASYILQDTDRLHLILVSMDLAFFAWSRAPDAVLLDIGCCFGVDARKAAADGFPAKNIIASDVVNEFLHLSHELFKTTPASYPGCLLPGDAFDPEFLSIVAPSYDVSPAPAIDLSLLKSLNPLHGRISAINAIAFFHLFNEEKQLHVARALAGLLSAQPGSVICGFDTGSLKKGIVTANLTGIEYQTFSHSPETWSSLWDGDVFKKGTVKVETEMMELSILNKQHLMMRWWTEHVDVERSHGPGALGWVEFAGWRWADAGPIRERGVIVLTVEIVDGPDGPDVICRAVVIPRTPI
ncbi:hypothetical protein BD769DRAFT_1387555 [Suillus cothurnatus]|nr:hypothetical protein BD769DRAFT_1387555 [Suillus cothurnatus]